MSLELLLEQFDQTIQTSADIYNLNSAILGWAVRGQLVPQFPDEEQASKIIRRIQIEREKLILEKKIKGALKVKPILPKDAPFKLPTGWVWARLGELVSYIGSGSTPRGGKKVYQENGIKFIRSQNVWNDGLRLDDVACISEQINAQMERTVVKPKDILLNITGASIGRSALVPDDFDIGNVSQHVTIIRLIDQRLRQFIHKCIISNYFQSTIMDVQVGISREGLSKRSLYQFLVPIPPLDEQQRIITKVDDLFEQTSELDDFLEATDTQRKKFHTAAIHRLTGAETPKETGAAWHLIRDNFDRLYTEPETIDELKQAILQLAVMGRLVPQDPKDEPAEVLLERIAAVKIELVKAGKIQKSKKSKPFTNQQIPHLLPSSWKWVRLSEVCFVGPRNYAPDNLKVAFIPMKLVPKEYGDEVDYEIMKWGDIKSGYTHFQENDVAFAKITPCFQNLKSAVLRNLPNEMGAGTTEIVVFRPIANCLLPEFILMFFKTPRFIGDGITRMTGTAGQQRVPKEYYLNVPFPVPPYKEQKRIVAKVDEIFFLCDQLSVETMVVEAIRDKLLDAILIHE